MPTFGALLKQFLQDRDMLQKQLAVDLGIHRNTIGRWINGDRQPDLARVHDIADMLGLDTREHRQLCLAAGYMPEDDPSGRSPHEMTSMDIADDLDTIKGMVREIRAAIDDTARLRAILSQLEWQRRDAIRKLSQTQRQVLAVMPTHPMQAPAVLTHIRTQIPSLRTVRTKELYLRLHELRYVGLIQRRKDAQHTWWYWVDTTQLWLLNREAEITTTKCV